MIRLCRKVENLVCGRYYVDNETAREINEILSNVDEKIKKAGSEKLQLHAKDIHPTDVG